MITDFLPYTQPESTLTVLHISIKSKKQTMRNGFTLIQIQHYNNLEALIFMGPATSNYWLIQDH